jgi:hypothetical protein
MLGKVIFSLDVRASLSEEEQASIKRYKLGASILYERKPLKEADEGFAMLRSALAYRFLNLTISVNDLADGKAIECKDIIEMLAAEEQVKEAAHTLVSILGAASHFDGEEVLELA